MARTLLVGTRKGLFSYTRDGDGWGAPTVDFLGDPVALTFHDARDGASYAALDHGHFGNKLHRQDAGGEWVEIAVPEYPEKPAEADDIEPNQQQAIPWTLKLIWALAAGGDDQPGRLWCGTLPGGLFRSDDRGDTWQLVESLWFDERRKEWFGGGADWPGIHSICVDPRDSDHVTVAISCGGVWVTRDGGDSWDCRADGMVARFVPPDQADNPNIQDPHQMVQCRDAPDSLWVQHHNGIFRSTDASESWTEISEAGPSTFGFAVAVHPADPETAWFVPAVKDEQRYPADAKVVVTRTRDGGASFDVLTEGLPQSFAYDLVYRHALDICDAGDTLAFGSTTGSLWVSDDQGDHWTALGEHLPPVYCVRVVG